MSSLRQKILSFVFVGKPAWHKASQGGGWKAQGSRWCDTVSAVVPHSSDLSGSTGAAGRHAAYLIVAQPGVRGRRVGDGRLLTA
jgi:hypothetical protein